MNRRDLLLLTASSVVPDFAFASVIPPPPSSPWYLFFIADGIYKISELKIIQLPASVGNCRSYARFDVAYAVAQNFNFTGRTGISAWNMLAGAPSYRYWEVLDLRNGRFYKLYEGDRLEAKFADGSRVKVIFRGPNSSWTFDPLIGSERLPDGTRLYPRLSDQRTGEHPGKERGRDGGGVTPVRPTTYTFSWHWSTQETPW